MYDEHNNNSQWNLCRPKVGNIFVEKYVNVHEQKVR